jgi:hypothetical protein
MKYTIIAAISAQVACILAAPVAQPAGDLAKDSIVIKAVNTYKREPEASQLDKDSIYIKAVNTY